MSKFGKIRNISDKTTTHRGENIFLKYLSYKWEKKRHLSFSDSVVTQQQQTNLFNLMIGFLLLVIYSKRHMDKDKPRFCRATEPVF